MLHRHLYTCREVRRRYHPTGGRRSARRTRRSPAGRGAPPRSAEALYPVPWSCLRLTPSSHLSSTTPIEVFGGIALGGDCRLCIVVDPLESIVTRRELRVEPVECDASRRFQTSLTSSNHSCTSFVCSIASARPLPCDLTTDSRSVVVEVRSVSSSINASRSPETAPSERPYPEPTGRLPEVQ